MSDQLKAIDPSLELLKDFSRITRGTASHIQKMRQDVIFTDGAISAKHKSMVAILWAVSSRCEPCIRFYVQKAVQLGASQEEMGEFLAVGSTMGGCVGEMWSLKAYKAYCDAIEEAPAPAESSCCHD